MFLFVFSGKNYFWLGENVKREDAIYLQKSKYHAISFEEILSTISSNLLINFCPKDMLTRTVPLRHSPHSSPPHLMTEYLSFWIFFIRARCNFLVRVSSRSGSYFACNRIKHCPFCSCPGWVFSRSFCPPNFLPKCPRVLCLPEYQSSQSF